MSETNNQGGRRRHTAGALDIRNVIGGLLGLYGVVLLVVGLVSDDGSNGTPAVHANLWAGVVLLVVGAVFLGWARLRPIVVDEAIVARTREQDDDLPPAG